MPYSYTKLLQNLNITDALLQNLGFHSHFAEFVFRGRPFTEFVSQTPCRISYFRVALLQNFTDTFQQNSYFTDGLLQNSHFADALQISYFAVALLQNSYISQMYSAHDRKQWTIREHRPIGNGSISSAVLCDWCLFASTVSCLLPLSYPCSSGGRILFSRVNFLCWLLFRYTIHPRVTAVARKKSRSFCQKCRWQDTAEHACTLRMWLCMKWHDPCVYGVQNAPRRQQFHVATSLAASAVSTPLRWILKNVL